ncbi:MAG: tyrosine-type recombinase/integrase [Opitutaceae bacterium]
MRTRLRKNRGGTYSVIVRDANGRERSIGTGATNREDAVRIASDSGVETIQMAGEAGLLRDRAISILMANKKLSCEDAVVEYLKSMRLRGRSPATVEHTKVMLNQWVRVCGTSETMIGAVTEEDIDRFINAEDETVLATRKSRLSALRGMFEWALEHGLRIGNPAGKKRVAIDMRRLSHAQKEPRVRQPISPEEFARITGVAEGFWAYAAQFSYWTGMRMVDVCTLEWDQFTETEIIVWTRKSGARVALPMNDPLIGGGILFDLLGKIPILSPKFVFPVERVVAIDPSARPQLSVQFGRLLKQADVSGKCFHCFRHSFATRLSLAGVDLSSVARLIGHRSEETTKVYTVGRDL